MSTQQSAFFDDILQEIDILVVGAQPSGGEYALKGACQQGQVSFLAQYAQ